jgi:hypothetical protein
LPNSAAGRASSNSSHHRCHEGVCSRSDFNGFISRQRSLLLSVRSAFARLARPRKRHYTFARRHERFALAVVDRRQCSSKALI